MPEVIDPPKVPFSKSFAASRPKDATEMKAMEAGEARKPEAPAAAPKPDPSPAKPVEAKPEAKADPDQEILEGKRTPKNDDFKRVKQAATKAAEERDSLKAKTGEYEKELGELRKAPKHNADLIKKIEVERDELKAKWQAVAAQFDSGFHAKYDQMVETEMERLKGDLPLDRADKFRQLFQMANSEWKRKAMAELTEDMDPPTVTSIMLANRAVQDIQAARKKELEDSGAILKTSAEARQKEQADRKVKYEQSFDSVLKQKSTGDDALAVLQVKEGDTAEDRAWNRAVAERAAIARAVFMDEFDTPEEKAEASIWAASAPGFLSELKSVQAENATLKETLAKLQGASPGIGSGGKAQDSGKKMTFTERMVAGSL